jgi:hypothetical protein
MDLEPEHRQMGEEPQQLMEQLNAKLTPLHPLQLRC